LANGLRVARYLDALGRATGFDVKDGTVTETQATYI
jgi:hypothetical protein